TRKTRGSPPGALLPAVMRVPGTKPSSIRRRASSMGKSIRSRMAAEPFRRSTRLARGASACSLLPLSCNMILVCASPKPLSRGGASLPRRFFCHGSPRPPKCAKLKDNKMEKRFEVRRVRQRDLDRILEIEAASFGADAYDRNLFAEYTRKCRGLFLVAERGTK